MVCASFLLILSEAQATIVDRRKGIRSVVAVRLTVFIMWGRGRGVAFPVMCSGIQPSA